jgi:uncharacterized membrane protein YdfJ with MMPL/SSD domain
MSEHAVALAVKQLAQKWLALEKYQAKQRMDLLLSIIEEQNRILAGLPKSESTANLKTQQAISQLQAEALRSQNKVTQIHRAQQHRSPEVKVKAKEPLKAPAVTALPKTQAELKSERQAGIKHTAKEPSGLVQPTKPVTATQAQSRNQARNIEALDAEIESTRSKVEKLQNSLKKVVAPPVVQSSTVAKETDDREAMMRRVLRRRRRRAR